MNKEPSNLDHKYHDRFFDKKALCCKSSQIMRRGLGGKSLSRLDKERAVQIQESCRPEKRFDSWKVENIDDLMYCKYCARIGEIRVSFARLCQCWQALIERIKQVVAGGNVSAVLDGLGRGEPCCSGEVRAFLKWRCTFVAGMNCQETNVSWGGWYASSFSRHMILADALLNTLPSLIWTSHLSQEGWNYVQLG
jgi:hypothetical protein